MNNKKINYILLMIVLIVWTIILYKIFNPIEDTINISKDNLEIKNNIRDTVDFENYVLLLNYPDPFTKSHTTYNRKTYSFDKVQNNTSTSNINSNILEPQKQDLPKIEYISRIFNKSTNKSIAIIRWADKEYTCSVKDNVNGVLINRILEDSIECIFNNTKWYVKK